MPSERERERECVLTVSFMQQCNGPRQIQVLTEPNKGVMMQQAGYSEDEIGDLQDWAYEKGSL